MTWPLAERWRAPVADFPPLWASAWGDDEYGLWAELRLASARMRLRWIEPTGPAGFWMGSPRSEIDALPDQDLRDWAHRTESDPRRVVVAPGFWLGEGPCAQAEWEAVMGHNPSEFRQGEDAARRPVENVSYEDVQEFVRKLGSWLPEGCEAELPSETQWEYAARAGSETAYPWGDEAEDGRANWDQQQGGTTPVGRYPPNGWGLLDMHGNVFEWCADEWQERTAAADGGDDAGPRGRAVRGGSWLDPPGDARSAYRYVGPPGIRYRSLGFRLALRSPGPASAR